jgi:hypothetical protein
MASTRSHWDGVYGTRGETDVSWYQPHSLRSLAMIAAAAPDHGASIVDIGGGASTVVDDLLARGYTDVSVLDVSDTALAKSKARLGPAASKVSWLVADITRWTPPRSYEVWHDRAVFHFLTGTAQQDAYLAALAGGTHPGSAVIIATFALDGPERCSGLPVQRYSAPSLAKRLGPRFTLVDQAAETHRTPSGTEQRFQYSLFRRDAA